MTNETSPLPSSGDRAGRPGWILWAGVAAVIAVVALVAVLVSGGDDKPSVKEETSSKVETGPANSEAQSGSTLPGNGEQTQGDHGSHETTGSGDALPLMQDGGPDSAIGMQLPTLKGSSATANGGVEITNDGKAKVIVVMAHWCPHCQREIPEIAKYLKSNPLPEGVELYGVSTAVDATAGNYPPSDWLKREGWTVPTLADSQDGTAAQALGTSGFPFFVAVDKDNKVVARSSGELPMPAFGQLLEFALTGQTEPS